MARAMLAAAPLLCTHRYELVIGADLLKRPDDADRPARPNSVIDA
jgi:hypothetical protein